MEFLLNLVNSIISFKNHEINKIDIHNPLLLNFILLYF